jgi:hypothetical protein
VGEVAIAAGDSLGVATFEIEVFGESVGHLGVVEMGE